ncbi:UNVERIFIED_ORG: hypothetical protein FNL38_107294 [Nocardia globerula]|uniref:Uncharacterized protein n=2 Tax=Nocardiaceae TaxID=85025 RepID=A0A652YKI6_NOCGL|nr:hypothetical protein C8E04_3452 [Rhodococcus globerulus]
MNRMRASTRHAAMVVGAVTILVTGIQFGTASAQQVSPTFEVLCTPTDTGLTELSGLADTSTGMYAIGDSGADNRIAELDAGCHVTRWIPVGTETYDVEDLDSTTDGTLWLADIGDNNKIRTSVALIGFDPSGAEAATPRVLTYPDGAHDAETLLISHDGLPVIVTKDYLGSSDIYAPAGNQNVHDLSTTVPTQLNKVGHLQFSPTTTPGGPVDGAGTMAVTGGAVSTDGTVVALRTYTDVYLYSAPDGDVVKALSARAIRVPLPNEPQGEAIAFNNDGDLISGSEAYQGPLPPLLILRGATALAVAGGSAGPLGSTGS